MHGSSGMMQNSANLRGAKTGIDFSVLGIGLNVNEVISTILKIKEPRKTWGFLCGLMWQTKRIEMTERVAKHRLAGTREYTGAEIRALLQSEDGIDFLVALMEDAEPKWWWWAKQVMAVASIKRRRAEDEQEILKLETSAPAETGARRRIKGALDANRNIKSGIDRAETTLGFQRPDLARRDADALGSMARVSNRPMAKGRGR